MNYLDNDEMMLLAPAIAGLRELRYLNLDANPLEFGGLMHFLENL